MADINIQMHKKNSNGTYDNIFPKAKASYISTTDGSNVQTKLDLKANLTDIPTTLKNPYAITFTGGVAGLYDGSTAKSVAIPTTLPANGGTSANTTSIAGALTVSTSAPSSVLAAGTLWAVV